MLALPLFFEQEDKALPNIKSFKVGKTRLKKVITCAAEENLNLPKLIYKYCSDFLSEDFFDAYCIFEFLIQREIRHNQLHSEEMRLFEKNQKIIKEIICSSFIEEEKLRLGLKTSLDVCLFGSRLTNIEFKDF